MTDRNIELSRRKILGAAGAIGIAGAGAGMGTSALFSDEESFTNNSIEAGTLDLVIDYVTTVTQDGVSTGSTTNDGTIQGGVSGEYQIADAKPGDSGFLAFCPKIVDNPGWLFVGSAEGVTDYENGQTEPEEDVDPSDGGNLDNGTNDGEGAGELSEAIQVDLEYCEVASNVDEPSGPDDYSTIREFNNPDDYTLADLFKELESGFLLDGDADPANGTTEFPSSPDQDTQNGPCLCISWELPAEVGNEVQSDAVEFDITFAARQWRNNPNPENPFADTTVYPGNSIQSAIDSADDDKVISVFGGSFGDGSEYSEALSIDKSLTLARASAEQPTINAGPTHDSTGDTSENTNTGSAVSIETSGVTIDGFEINNPDGLLGIKVQPDVDNVTICNNTVRDIGPTEFLGVAGINVGNGSHQNIRIVGNVVENLRQEIGEASQFGPTVNGILFDADTSSDTLTNATVANNIISGLESDYAPLGIVLQHNVNNVAIENNEISDVTAAHSLDSDDTDDNQGEFTTFAQGINIASGSTANLRITGNVIAESVTSEDGFWGEAIKIDGNDVSGISISQNDLLSPFGITNAASGTVDAENNYWNSSTGPNTNQNQSSDPTLDVRPSTASVALGPIDADPFLTSSIQ